MSSAELAQDLVGTGPAVVLIHAGIADRRMWHAQLAALRDRFRVLAPDLRGFGDSPPARGPFSPAADVLARMDAAGIDRATLVGVSMGGEVALDIALTAPERVERLALVSTLAGSTEPSAQLVETWETGGTAFEEGDLERAVAIEVETWLLGAGRSASDVDPAYLELATAMIRRTWERASSGLEVGEPEQLDPPRIERLGEIALPALLVAGDRDLPDVAASMDRLAAEIPGAVRAPTIPNCAHLPPLEQPEAFNRLLLAFLTG